MGRMRGAWLLLCLSACSEGALDPAAFPTSQAGAPATPFDPANPLATGGTAAPGSPGSMAAAGAAAPTATVPEGCEAPNLEARAVLMAPRQYVNVLRDVIGPTAVSEQDAAASGELLFDTVDIPRVTTAVLDRYARLSERATESLRGQTATFLGCGSLMDQACVRPALERVARRAYKRAITPEESSDLMAVRDAGLMAFPNDQGETGAIAALHAILLSPSSLYRTEFYAAAGAGGQRDLTAHERAAALAAFLLDSIPDDALLAAADDGSLLTGPGLQTQVDRLLALPRVQKHVTQLVLTAFNVPRVFITPKDLQKYPQYTADLQKSMYEETRRFVEDILWTRKAPLSELLTSRRSFVDPALAKLYGVPAPVAPAGETFAPVELPPERAGLLTHASVLSVLSRTDKNSVVARGLFMRGNVLCLPKVPGPPTSVLAQVAMQLEADASEKELAEYRAKTSPCLGCHLQFDRFGLLLEPFDPIGRYSAAEAEPVDFAGLTPLDGVFQNVEGLSARLQQDHMFESCFADRTLGYALTVATNSEARCLAATGAIPNMPAGGTIRDLVLAVAQSAAFNVRTLEP